MAQHGLSHVAPLLLQRADVDDQGSLSRAVVPQDDGQFVADVSNRRPDAAELTVLRTALERATKQGER